MKTKFRQDTFNFPMGVRLINRLFSSYAHKKFNVDELLARAKNRTELTDLGDDFFMKPLKVLVDDINANTEFHALGAFLYKSKIVANLTNRLWANYWIQKDSSINRPLPPKVLITGLQRTGTTFLQRLLGNMPEFRGVISWEIINPVPTSKRKNYYGKYQARIGHFLLNYINPEFKSIHSVKYNSLEEEVVIMDHAFMSTATGAALNVPNYTKWCENQDQTKVYEDLEMWLKLLLWRQPANEFLLLKSPHHMEYLDTFLKVFRDVKIIQTHRAPAKTLASYCSMVHFGKKIFSPTSNPYEVGSYWLKKNKRLMDHCMSFKDKNPGLFIDISYKNLIADPVKMVEKIYLDLGLEWTQEHALTTEKFCREHTRNKYGKHTYSLEDYGLTEERVNEEFKEYLEAYAEYL